MNIAILTFDLKPGKHRDCVLSVARDFGLHVVMRSGNEFHVHINEAMDAYRLGREVYSRMQL